MKTKEWPAGILKRVSREAYDAVRRARGYCYMTPKQRETAALTYDMGAKKRLIGYVHPIKGFRTVEETLVEKHLDNSRFNAHANVFNKAEHAVTFARGFKEDRVAVKVGRKYTVVRREFAKRMGLKIIK